MPVFTAIDDENPARAIRVGLGVFRAAEAGATTTAFSGGTVIGDTWEGLLGCHDLVEVNSWIGSCRMIHDGQPVRGVQQCTKTVRWHQKPAMVYDAETNEYRLGCAKDGSPEVRTGCDGCTSGVLA